MSDLRRKNYKQALTDLLRAAENGWLDSTWPKNTNGKQWGQKAVEQAREILGKRQPDETSNP